VARAVRFPFIGTPQSAYALAIEFTGALGAIGLAAATLVWVCVLVANALAAVAILVHESESAISAVLIKLARKLTPAGP